MRKFFKNRTVIGLICIILSLIICFGLTPLFNDALQAKTEVVRIIKDITKGEMVTDKHIEVVEVGGYNMPSNVLKSKDNIIGKYTLADLYKGDYILNTKLSDNPFADNNYLYNFDGTKRAVSITIKSFASGLSGKLERNDIISIIAVDFGEQRETYVPIELQYIKVLAVTTSQGMDRERDPAKEDKDEKEELPSTITVIVDTVQSMLLAELEEKSKIHIALVYRGSEETAQEFLNKQERIIAESTNAVVNHITIEEMEYPEQEMEESKNYEK